MFGNSLIFTLKLNASREEQCLLLLGFCVHKESTASLKMTHVFGIFQATKADLNCTRRLPLEAQSLIREDCNFFGVGDKFTSLSNQYQS
jgi:hypothetical protein